MPRFWRWIESTFQQTFVGFLSLIALTCALTPLFFTVSNAVAGWLMAIQWGVVFVFVLEYIAGLVLAEAKWAYVLQPARVFLAVLLAVAFASLLASVPDSFVAAPSLQVFHVLAALGFGLEAGTITVERSIGGERTGPARPMTIYVLNPGSSPRQATWLELVEWSESPTASWFHAENVSSMADLSAIAAHWQVPVSLLEACVGQENYPRVEFSHGTILLSVWLRGESPTDLAAAPVVLLVRGESVLSISRLETALPHRIQNLESEEGAADLSFAARMVLSVMELAMRYAEKRIDFCEAQLREMERTPVGKAKPTLFAQAYRTKQELSALHADLWRLGGMVTRLNEGRVKLAGAPAQLERLGRHIDFHYTTVNNLRDSVISLIELHINSASFEMTKFMRLLAVVNVVALVPAVASGLLGMNVSGAPWPLTLGQVTFVAMIFNVFCLYGFAVKGWLK